jgi:hypothetical protein
MQLLTSRLSAAQCSTIRILVSAAGLTLAFLTFGYSTSMVSRRRSGRRFRENKGPGLGFIPHRSLPFGHCSSSCRLSSGRMRFEQVRIGQCSTVHRHYACAKRTGIGSHPDSNIHPDSNTHPDHRLYRSYRHLPRSG